MSRAEHIKTILNSFKTKKPIDHYGISVVVMNVEKYEEISDMTMCFTFWLSNGESIKLKCSTFDL